MKMMQNGSVPGLSKRRVLLALSLTLVVLFIAVGGTIAWLQDVTGTITNTFTSSKVDIDLTESGTTDNAKSFQMIPGNSIGKDPKVTVKAGSEACWLFVEIVQSANFKDFMEPYATATGWFQLMDGANPVTGVFYRSVDAVTADTPFYVLNGNQVTVKSGVTETDMTNLGTNYPTLTFKAYAVQKANVATAIEGWHIIFPPTP